MGEGALTRILQELADGNPAAQGELMDTVYHELRRLAQSQMRRERHGHTLQPTALVNEAYLRLLESGSDWQNRRHFFGAAAEAMRRILIDHSRRRGAEKRGGGLRHVTLDGLEVEGDRMDIDLLELEEALTALEQHDERLARVVELRYFTGLGIEETADVLDISPATVKRDWAYGRAWLFDYMSAGDREGDG
ncbi:MAG: sigma-70 family RNA polymerase sigma factor [Gammaproteobacteria bacterium]|nr:sigma-70 family RNA polymerase sigma factor [Gammaproteobacteria bacterium]